MAIFIDGVKYACASCVRGHRVKKCNHADRELVELSKRGRQVSQCNHCRDLRKTNKSHVKCTCAISSAPNPINGCLCEVILHCTCVANHLQDVKEDDQTSTTVSSPTKEPCHENTITDKDTEFFNFLYNDLDKYLTPAPQFVNNN